MVRSKVAGKTRIGTPRVVGLDKPSLRVEIEEAVAHTVTKVVVGEDVKDDEVGSKAIHVALNLEKTLIRSETHHSGVDHFDVSGEARAELLAKLTHE